MELEGDFTYAIPLIFTVLAVILATIWVKLLSVGEKQPANTSQQEQEEVTKPVEEEEKTSKEDHVKDEVAARTETGTFPIEEVGTAEELPDTKESGNREERTPSSQSSREEEEGKTRTIPLDILGPVEYCGVGEEDTEGDKVLNICEAEDADDEDFSFKYLPGKLRGSDYEKMLTKDELEEEQRIELTSDLTSL
ncbi:matrix-remodeling-associated protein 7 isoform X2 [Hyperolius riggenbachi]|uniref:matrix-remodeling-associated protein 7 isoform X2 n=1 Tax=Hyperolius riggenbachi TaxID=752182 RepID=UPI0035A26B71